MAKQHYRRIRTGTRLKEGDEFKYKGEWHPTWFTSHKVKAVKGLTYRRPVARVIRKKTRKKR